MNTENSIVIAKGKRGVVGEGKGDILLLVMEGDLTWGGEHTIHCTNDVL